MLIPLNLACVLNADDVVSSPALSGENNARHEVPMWSIDTKHDPTLLERDQVQFRDSRTMKLLSPRILSSCVFLSLAGTDSIPV